MSILSQISTFFTTTLFWMYAFLLRPFTRRPSHHDSSVTPYPFAPDLETRVIDITCDSGGGVKTGKDLEQGLSVDTTGLFTLGVHTKTAASNHNHPQPATLGPYALSRRSSLSAQGAKGKMTFTAALSTVTNYARTSAAPHKCTPTKSDRENAQAPPRKITPLRQMPRYLNLTGTSPTKSGGSLKPPPGCGGSKSRRSTLAGPVERTAPRPRKSVSFATAESSPCISPAKPEQRRKTPGASIDFAARVRSAFYKRDDMFDDDVRHLFNRDSLISPSAACECDSEDEDDHSKPRPSRLPYLRDSTASWASASSSSGVSDSSAGHMFNDLLASVDRKYPGEWADIVQIAVGEKCEDRVVGSGKSYGGVRGGETPWSEVLCLEEYAV
ncbi:hypothetical protein B0H15DRAFT_930882 [Mycena belliarum]|uniref:Uncharacterized protein n=1 Tax=Mycena belliarum TaxID=1033014 RepID=A0AAD6U360_9AGAR|nr:hypothetical protein B0H15DRAFT_930882 [Mycena belliae]